MQLNAPTLLTFLRILLIPVLVGLFFLPGELARTAAAWVFLLAAVTDWADGYLARKLHQWSAFGEFLDPVADKLMVAVVLILLVQDHPDGLFAIMASVIVGREITISALREWMAVLGESTRVRVAMIGKTKTVVQMIALFLLLYAHPIAGLPSYWLGYWLLATAAILTLVSMVLYVRDAWPVIMRGEHGGPPPQPPNDA